jgi:nucleoside 2-deoxyribosyltransferase
MVEAKSGQQQVTVSKQPQPGRKRIYLAGPEVFLPDAVAAGHRKKVLCGAYGFEGLYPFDNEAAPGAGQDRRIYNANLAMIRAADAGICNLTPFRGPSADPGTVFELGLLTGLNKPVFGYTNAAPDLRARVKGAIQRSPGKWFDADGLEVEDFGNADNLMIDCCLAEGGFPIVRVDAGSRLDALDGFEACLKRARLALDL